MFFKIETANIVSWGNKRQKAQKESEICLWPL